MRNRPLSCSLMVSFIVAASACSSVRVGDAVALNGTGLAYRNGGFQLIDGSRHVTYGFVSSPALERWISDGHLFRDKDPHCLVLVFDVRGRGTLFRAAEESSIPPRSALVNADELSLSPSNDADTKQRVKDTGVEALEDRRVCATA